MPSPTVSRPPLIRSPVARALASQTGSCRGATTTVVFSRTRRVQAAQAPSRAISSGLPKATRSPKHSEAKGPWSTARAHRSSISPSIPGSISGSVIPTFIAVSWLHGRHDKTGNTFILTGSGKLGKVVVVSPCQLSGFHLRSWAAQPNRARPEGKQCAPASVTPAPKKREDMSHVCTTALHTPFPAGRCAGPGAVIHTGPGPDRRSPGHGPEAGGIPAGHSHRHFHPVRRQHGKDGHHQL